jgi:two-component system chemotaxis response regulator CheY
MINVMEWVARQESAACSFYTDAAGLFKDDSDLHKLLLDLADDESSHYHAMVSGLEFLKSQNPPIVSMVTLDEKSKSQFEGPLLQLRAILEAGTLSKEMLLQGIVTVEYHELNDIFLYAISVLSDKKHAFRDVASKIEQHKKRIEEYFRTLDSKNHYLSAMRTLPEVRKQKILIVEDFYMLRDLLASLLRTEGVVHTAANGKEALAKMNEAYYDVIISDVEMPVMNGIELFEHATKKYGTLLNRFLFHMSPPSSEAMNFIDKNEINYLLKPSDLDVLRKTVHGMLQSSIHDI